MSQSALVIGALFAWVAYMAQRGPRAEGFVSGWREHRNRGNPMHGKYPPCYDICGATRTIFDVLEKAGKVQEHAELLDGYSMVLCQEKHMDRACQNGMLLRRINELSPASATSPKVDSYSPNAKALAKEFLVRITPVLERGLQKVMQDSGLTEADKDTIAKMHEVFYVVHYPKIEGC
jgi:hypothetical protein